jgi:hypothetical protein
MRVGYQNECLQWKLFCKSACTNFHKIYWQNITVWKIELIFLTVYESESWDASSIDLTSDASKTHADPIFYTRCCQMQISLEDFLYTENTQRWHSWSFIARKIGVLFHFHRRYENAKGVIHKVLVFFKERQLLGHFYERKYLGLSNSFKF